MSAKNSVQKQEILLIIDSYHLKYETQTDDSIDTCEDETEIFEGRRGFSRTEMKKSWRIEISHNFLDVELLTLQFE